jgi:Ca2+-binding RTX toxin-like protein
VIVGRRGRDRIGGFGGHDLLHGGAGKDSLAGRGGEDLLDGGKGLADNLWGGKGNDSCVNGSWMVRCE